MTNQPMKKKLRASLYGLIGLILLFYHCAKQPELPDPLEAGWHGTKVCQCIEEQPTLRILKCTFPPGIGHERHFHTTHFGYTLKGSRFRIKDATGTRR